jgi:hypothetical protein
MDGPAMISRLQAERPDIKVLLICAYSMELVTPDLRPDFLAKPFLPADIEKKVQKMLVREPASSGAGKLGLPETRNTDAWKWIRLRRCCDGGGERIRGDKTAFEW